MDLDAYLNENLNEILENPNDYVSTSKNKVIIGESKNAIKLIDNNKNNFDNENIDLDEKEYLEYNQEFFNNSFEYYHIDCIDDEDNEDDEYNEDNEDNKNINYEKNNNYQDTYNEIDTKNEDDYNDDIIDELYEKMYETSQPKINLNQKDFFENLKQLNLNLTDEIKNDIEIEKLNENTELLNDNGYYFFNLINIFMKYFNNKYDKKEHFFSNIVDMEKGTTDKMEIFFDSVMEFKIMLEHMGLDNDEGMKQLYKETEPEKISSMFEKWDKQIYMFEIGELKLFSPCLIICLNYVYEKNLLNEDWNIYNLRDN